MKRFALILVLCNLIAMNAMSSERDSLRMFLEYIGEDSTSIAKVIESPYAADSASVIDTLYDPIMLQPEFPGGMHEMFNFIKENLNYPKQAIKKNIQGRAICHFIVEKDGSITNVEVVRSSGNKSLDKAAIRVIKMMPKWKPATMQGKIIRVKYVLPIVFKIP